MNLRPNYAFDEYLQSSYAGTGLLALYLCIAVIGVLTLEISHVFPIENQCPCSMLRHIGMKSL